jgi:hypothetical protein
MKLSSWQFVLGVTLAAASAITYLLQIMLFHRAGDTFFYMVQDLAFLPVQVLFVTVILNELFKRREKAALQSKMNMVIGAFFSEVGLGLLKSFGEYDARAVEINKAAVVKAGWTDKDFTLAAEFIKSHEFGIDSRKGDLASLKEFLVSKRGFLLRLLENPNLLEHESFTELLWAVFHLTEELAHRKDTAALPPTDHDHLSGDIKRVYAVLITQWLAYLRHLRDDYPFMFSLLLRTNPLDENASPEVLQ